MNLGSRPLSQNFVKMTELKVYDLDMCNSYAHTLNSRCAEYYDPLIRFEFQI